MTEAETGGKDAQGNLKKLAKDARKGISVQDEILLLDEHFEFLTNRGLQQFMPKTRMLSLMDAPHPDELHFEEQKKLVCLADGLKCGKSGEYYLMYSLGLRMLSKRETCHDLWNHYWNGLTAAGETCWGLSCLYYDVVWLNKAQAPLNIRPTCHA